MGEWIGEGELELNGAGYGPLHTSPCPVSLEVDPLEPSAFH